MVIQLYKAGIYFVFSVRPVRGLYLKFTFRLQAKGIFSHRNDQNYPLFRK